MEEGEDDDEDGDARHAFKVCFAWLHAAANFENVDYSSGLELVDGKLKFFEYVGTQNFYEIHSFSKEKFVDERTFLCVPAIPLIVEGFVALIQPISLRGLDREVFGFHASVVLLKATPMGGDGEGPEIDKVRKNHNCMFYTVAPSFKVCQLTADGRQAPFTDVILGAPSFGNFLAGKKLSSAKSYFHDRNDVENGIMDARESARNEGVDSKGSDSNKVMGNDKEVIHESDFCLPKRIENDKVMEIFKLLHVHGNGDISHKNIENISQCLKETKGNKETVDDGRKIGDNEAPFAGARHVAADAGGGYENSEKILRKEKISPVGKNHTVNCPCVVNRASSAPMQKGTSFSANRAAKGDFIPHFGEKVHQPYFFSEVVKCDMHCPFCLHTLPKIEATGFKEKVHPLLDVTMHGNLLVHAVPNGSSTKPDVTLLLFATNFFKCPYNSDVISDGLTKGSLETKVQATFKERIAHSLLDEIKREDPMVHGAWIQKATFQRQVLSLHNGSCMPFAEK